jgi:hypothetical protein
VDVGLTRIANVCSLTAAYLLIFRRKTAYLRIMQRILVCNKVGIGIEIPNRLVYWLTHPHRALAYLASTQVSSGPKTSSLTAEVSAAATTWRELAGRLNPDVVHVRAGPGAGERSRTPDLRITNALLYHLSYAGVESTRSLADVGNLVLLGGLEPPTSSLPRKCSTC